LPQTVKLLVGGLTGSLLGVPFVWLGLPTQGAATALVGGLAGTGLVLSAMRYRTTVFASARQIARGVCVFWAASFLHKIPGTGGVVQELMTSLRSHDALLRDEATRPAPIAHAGLLQLIGCGVGAVAGALVGGVLTTFPLTKWGGANSLKDSAGFVLLFAVCGAFWGPALSLLFKPGRHRPLILMALVTGITVGTAFGLSVHECAVLSPVASFAVGIGVAGAFCLAACLGSNELSGLE
jgi:hypothetical protein